MRTARLVLAALAVLLVAAGCTSGDSEADALSWLRDQDSVASASTVSYNDPSDGSFIRITLQRRQSDSAVMTLTRSIKRHFDDAEDRPNLELDVDGFRASIFPGLPGDKETDPDLKAALWLRADGRATAFIRPYYSPVSSHPVVIAPAAKIGQLALDYTKAVPNNDRRTESIESSDGTTGVQWSTIPSLGATLDLAAAGEFARLQRAYPGTTGWLDDSGTDVKAAIHFAAADVPLSRVGPGALVNPKLFKSLELGWGPARDPAADFPTTFAAPRTRQALTDLSAIPGVAEFDGVRVVVRTGAAFTQVRRYVQRTDMRLVIELRRAPVLYDYRTQPVFSSYAKDSEQGVAVYRTVADLPGIVRVEPLGGGRGVNLFVDDAVSATELRTALKAVAGLPALASATVYGSVPGDYRTDTTIPIGRTTATGFVRDAEAGTGAPRAYPQLVTAVERAWKDVRPKR